MSTRGQFNTKNPTIKRILKEATELSTAPSTDYHAEPLETNLFEWHFTIRGPPAPSSYAGGIYHGRIILPPQYPLRPPAFRFVTPTGRFEVNREICLSISGHHEETWQPAWGVRTALVAIRSFMDTEAKGQLGGLECSKEAREKMARESGAFKCPTCAKTNTEIMKEREEMVKEIEEKEGKRQEEQVPEELRLAYREELGKKEDDQEQKVDKGKGRADTVSSSAVAQSSTTSNIPTAPTSTSTSISTSTGAPNATQRRLVQSAQGATVPIARQATAPIVQQVPPRDPSLAWIDTCIYGIVAALLFMVLRKFG